MQTKINYLYRDASNWKFRGFVVVEGIISKEMFGPMLFDTDQFVPHEVGLMHLLDMPINEDDHYLHELEEFEAVEGHETICDSNELLNRFAIAAEKGWLHSII